jgi:AraC family transcriptional regulator
MCRTGGAKPEVDPLAAALERKASTGSSGRVSSAVLFAGEGWRVLDVVCTCGPRDPVVEERHGDASISLVLAGTFVCRSPHGRSLLSAGSLFLGSAGQVFECSHQHGEGDRCLSFHFDADTFERLAHDAGAPRASFDHHALPPLRDFAPVSARAQALSRWGGKDEAEEVAFEFAGTVLRALRGLPVQASSSPSQQGRIARLLRQLETAEDKPRTLAELAEASGLSRYHFLRTFRDVTGVTPHQWLLRTRLRDAAERLASGRGRITDIAFVSGFEDLSNFVRSFRSEFGMSPRAYRAAA